MDVECIFPYLSTSNGFLLGGRATKLHNTHNIFNKHCPTVLYYDRNILGYVLVVHNKASLKCLVPEDVYGTGTRNKRVYLINLHNFKLELNLRKPPSSSRAGLREVRVYTTRVLTRTLQNILNIILQILCQDIQTRSPHNSQ